MKYTLTVALLMLGSSSIEETQALQINKMTSEPKNYNNLETFMKIKTKVKLSIDRSFISGLAQQMKEEIKEAEKAVKDAEEAETKEGEEKKEAEEEKKAKDPEAEADEVAAEGDEKKADLLYGFAKGKVDDLVKKLKSLDAHIKEQYEILEAVLKNTEIDAEFDPEDEADIEWITGEITKILETTPEIEMLEKKLSKIPLVEPDLEKIVKDLKKVVDISGMIIEKEEEKKKGDKEEGKEGAKKGKDGKANKTKGAKEEEKKGDKKKATDAKKPAKDEEKKEEKKKDAKADAPEEAEPEAAKATKTSAIKAKVEEFK
jgi:hypothetical protein